MPEVGYLKSVHKSVLESLQNGMAFAVQKKFDEAFREYKKVSGALHLARFNGLSRVVEDLADATQAMKRDPSIATPAMQDILVKLTQESKQYVLDILADAPDVPMRLYENYRALRSGKKQGSHPSQLFFPNTTADWEVIHSDLVTSRDQEGKWRSEFASALTQWIKAPVESRDELLKAQSVLAEIEKTKLSSEMTGFINVAIAAIDVLAMKPGADGFDKVVMSRVDNEIKQWFETKKKPADDSLRYLLYLIGFSEVRTPRIEKVLNTYKIKEHIESIRMETHRKGRTLDEATLQPVKEALAHVKEAWSKFSQGMIGMQDMEKPATMLSERLPVFDHPAIKKLGDGLLQLIQGVRTGRVPINEMLTEEMASMLLLMEQAVEARGRVSARFEDNAIIQIRRTLAAVKNDKAALDAMPLPEIDQEALARNKKALRAQVLTEVKLQLGAAEEALDQWMREGGVEQKEEAVAAIRPLRKLGPVLLMARHPEASASLGKIMMGLEAIFGKAKHSVSEEEYAALSQQMAALSLYVEAELTEQSNTKRFLSVTSAEVEQQVSISKIQAAFSRETSPTVVAPRPQSHIQIKSSVPNVVEAVGEVDVVENGNVLLGLYLEDFDQQLKTMKDGSLLLGRDASNKDALMDVRRGFHTLKGSGRMVGGLIRLPNVAESIEVFLKKMLAEEKPVGQSMLVAIDEAINAFDGWRDELKATSKATIRRQPWMSTFDQMPANQTVQTQSSETVEGGKPKVEIMETDRAFPSLDSLVQVERVAQPIELALEDKEIAMVQSEIEVVSLPEVKNQEENTSEHVYVGVIVLDRGLYEAYVAEANGYVETLLSVVVDASAEAEKGVTKQFMRAAHTLGSASKTVGFGELAEVGYLIERWSEHQMGTGSWIGQEEWAALLAAVDHAHGLFECVKTKQNLVSDKEVLRNLERFLKSSAPVAVSVLQAPAAIDKETVKKLRALLKKQSAALRLQLGEVESMLMMLDNDDTEEMEQS
jgi:chemosensory pili system protein ChpA (sensor histidine kinase/response regulator)